MYVTPSHNLTDETRLVLVTVRSVWRERGRERKKESGLYVMERDDSLDILLISRHNPHPEASSATVTLVQSTAVTCMT